MIWALNKCHKKIEFGYIKYELKGSLNLCLLDAPEDDLYKGGGCNFSSCRWPNFPDSPLTCIVLLIAPDILNDCSLYTTTSLSETESDIMEGIILSPYPNGKEPVIIKQQGAGSMLEINPRYFCQPPHLKTIKFHQHPFQTSNIFTAPPLPNQSTLLAK